MHPHHVEQIPPTGVVGRYYDRRRFNVSAARLQIRQFGDLRLSRRLPRQDVLSLVLGGGELLSDGIESRHQLIQGVWVVGQFRYRDCEAGPLALKVGPVPIQRGLMNTKGCDTSRQISFLDDLRADQLLADLDRAA
jgi:hypothetical protein